jgi:hypothetical protein
MNQQIRFAKSGLTLHLNQSRGYADVVNSIIEYLCDCFHAEAAAYYSNSTEAYTATFKWREFTIEMSVTEVGITIKNLNPVIAREGDESIIDTLCLTFNGESFGTYRNHHLWYFKRSFAGYVNNVFDVLFEVLTEDTAILEKEE